LARCQICGKESGDRQMCGYCETLVNQELRLAEYYGTLLKEVNFCGQEALEPGPMRPAASTGLSGR
jgi:hypothetical protein